VSGRQIHDHGNGTFDAERLLEARVEALHAAVDLETALAGLRGFTGRVNMTDAMADLVRRETVYRAVMFERWLLRPDDGPDEIGPGYTIHEAG
jgi:hypothetical protein